MFAPLGLHRLFQYSRSARSLFTLISTCTAVLQVRTPPTRTNPKHPQTLNTPHKPRSPSAQEVAEFGKPGDLTMVEALLGAGSAPPPEQKPPQSRRFYGFGLNKQTYILYRDFAIAEIGA